MTDLDLRLQASLADRYVIERELGRGGMATVYLAQDLKHHRPVALKVLHAELAAVLGADRFLREIETAANLNHPHILPLFDSGAAPQGTSSPRNDDQGGSVAGQRGSEGALLWYAMPFVEGESLRDRLGREKQLAVPDALQIAREVADALSYAHGRGIIHRDIKPENILLAHGHALVADFGIARALGAAGGERLTETGLSIGTPSYMSPEQASGERDLDGRADIYALGCVLYEMLAGQPPFGGPTAQSIMARHAIDAVPPLHTVRPISPEVEAAVLKALAKVPADRFATAAQFRQALSTESGTSGTGPRRIAKSRVHRGLWVAVALVVGTVAVLSSRYLLSARATVDPPVSMIAVMPLTPSGADTGLVRLGRDLVVTLSANLDGVGDIRTVDANTILTRSAAGPSIALADAAAIARRLGAGRVIQGSLVRSGANVRVELGLFDSKDLNPLAHATVTASPDEPVVITDSLTAGVLAQIWQKGTPPSPSLAAVTTHSMPALRAFLDGERLLVEGNMDSAASAYQRAFTADSTFWLAYFRYGYTFNWMERNGGDSLADIAWQHRGALPERERLLVEILHADTYSVRLRQSSEFVERYPDYWPGWFQYADYLVHNDGTGYSLDQAIHALERTVELNPGVAWAWEHLFKLTLTNDTPRAARALAALTRLEQDLQPSSRPFYLQAYRLILQMAQAPQAVDTALMDSVARAYATEKVPGSFGGLDPTVGFLGYGFAGRQIEFNRRALHYRIDPGLAADFRLGIAVAWAGRGAWDSMQQALDEFVTAAPRDWGAGPAWQAYRFNVYGAWLGAVDPSVVLSRRNALTLATSRFPGSLSPYFELAFLPWIDGLRSYSAGDEAGLKHEGQVLGSDTLPTAPFLRRSLAAFDLGLAHRYRPAADSMVAIVRATSEGACCKGAVDDVNRMMASRWLLAAGDTVAAAGIIGQLDVYQWHLVFGAPMYLARGRINEALGRKEDARSDYAEFLRRYDLPAASERHLVDEAKTALRRLSGQQDPPEPR